MPFTLNDIGLGFGAPLLGALLLLLNLRWMLPSDIARRYAPGVAFVGGFELGYWLLKLGALEPESHWQWLPHMVVAALIVGVVSASEDLRLLDRLLIFAIASLGASFFLIPSWEGLEPPRIQYIAGTSSYVVLLALLFHSLIEKAPGPFFPLALFLTCTSGAVLLIHSGSLLFGQIGIAGAGAAFGIMVTSAIDKKCQPLDGLAFPAAFYLVMTMMIGHTNSFSSIPIYSYAILPVAPLGLFLSRSQNTGIKAAAVKVVFPLLICAVALGIAFWFEPFSDPNSEY